MSLWHKDHFDPKATEKTQRQEEFSALSLDALSGAGGANPHGFPAVNRCLVPESQGSALSLWGLLGLIGMNP